MKGLALGGNIIDAFFPEWDGPMVSARTNIGNGRKKNQDAVSIFYDEPSKRLFLAVADGLGSYGHSEWAALKAVTHLPEWINGGRKTEEAFFDLHEVLLTGQPFADRHAEGEKRAFDDGATTCVLADISKNTLTVSNIGDSRLYVLRENRVIYRTVDQSALELLIRQNRIHNNPQNLSRHPLRGVLLNALGGPEEVYDWVENGRPLCRKSGVPITEKLELKSGDTVILCTDGFFSNIDDGELADYISQTEWPRLSEVLHNRVQEVFLEGKTKAGLLMNGDNYTYVLYRHR